MFNTISPCNFDDTSVITGWIVKESFKMSKLYDYKFRMAQFFKPDWENIWNIFLNHQDAKGGSFTFSPMFT